MPASRLLMGICVGPGSAAAGGQAGGAAAAAAGGAAAPAGTEVPGAAP